MNIIRRLMEAPSSEQTTYTHPVADEPEHVAGPYAAEFRAALGQPDYRSPAAKDSQWVNLALRGELDGKDLTNS